MRRRWPPCCAIIWKSRVFASRKPRTAQEALTRIAETQPDLVLLDWMLPLMSGIEVCRQIRRRSATRDLPVIMVTARTEDQDAVRGLNTGADDYITKPFTHGGAAGAHARPAAPVECAADERPAGVPRHRPWTLPSHRVQRNGRPVHLGPTEFRLLEFFMQHPRRVFSREELLDAVWGPRHPCRAAHGRRAYPPAAQVDQRHGELDIVRTVRAAGYALDTEPV